MLQVREWTAVHGTELMGMQGTNGMGGCKEGHPQELVRCS